MSGLLGRTDTGTTATNGLSGSSSPSIRNRRSAPVQMAKTTSLTVVPMASFSRFTSWRPTAERATDRRLVRVPLNEVRGADRGSAALPSPGRLSDPWRTWRTCRMRCPVVNTSLAISNGRMVRAMTARVISSRLEGTWLSTMPGSGAGRSAGSGSRSKSTDNSSAPETPSTVEWCILAMNPMRPSDRPSTIHISHSGRARSSGRPVMSPATEASSRRPPGPGTAANRTW